MPIEPLTGQPTVLLAEDDPSVREYLRRVLVRGGCQVLAAAAGEEALDLARRHRIDLLVTDLTMAPLNGSEVSRRLGSSVPVLFISGYPRHATGLPEEALFLQKPFSPDELMTQVRQALGSEPAPEHG